jgi:hypothetical protein
MHPVNMCTGNSQMRQVGLMGLLGYWVYCKVSAKKAFPNRYTRI